MLLAGSAQAADIQTFARGSLIIPESGVFQTGCGAVSAYGLVWRLLRENRPGGAFATGGAYNGGIYPSEPVTVYWTINGDKLSNNRCTPTNLHTPPSQPANPAWIDGCDFTITNASEQPVVPVNYSLPWPASGVYPYAWVPNYNQVESKPNYPAIASGAAITLNNNNTNPRFTTIRYHGGPFVIDATDARRVIDFLRNSTDGDATTGILGFTANKAAVSPACAVYSQTVAATNHFVQMHQATIQFDAPVNKRINKVPPKIALLDRGDGVSNGVLTRYLRVANLLFPGAAGCPAGSTAGCTLNGGAPGEIYDEFHALKDLLTDVPNGLPKGLLNKVVAGKPVYRLFWAPHWLIGGTVQSCKVSDVADDASDAARTVGGTLGWKNRAANGNPNTCGAANTGSCRGADNDDRRAGDAASNKVKTYANCAAIDPAAVAQAAVDAVTRIGDNGVGVAPGYLGRPLVWTTAEGAPPTFSPAPTYPESRVYRAVYDAVVAATTPTGTTDPQRTNALENIAHFADQSGNGMFAECASLETFEGSWEAGTQKQVSWTPTTHFMFSDEIDINGLSTSAKSWDGKNCTDPDYVATGVHPSKQCVVYPNPGDPFSQIGDFRYASVGGHVHQFWPRLSVGSVMKPGVKRLAVSWENYTVGAYTGPPYTYSGDRGWDFFTLGLKDNDPNKATIVYLAGHTFDDDIAGTRIVLNTLLNLGSDPVLSDRTVTAPVAFDDTNGDLAAGTRALLFVSTYKALSGTLLPGNVDFDRASGSRWMFPFTKGDLRAHSIVGGSALANGSNALNAGVLWSADSAMPLPDRRNIFTYVGGVVTTSPSLPAGHRAPHGVLQQGWKPVPFHSSEIVTPVPSGTSDFAAPSVGCVDELKWDKRPEDGTDKLAFSKGSDGVCDLQQYMQYTTLHPDASWKLVPPDRDAIIADAPYVAQLISTVRGHCFANTTRTDGTGTPVLIPTDGQCNLTANAFQDNRAHLGGLVRSTAAVVPPSPNIRAAGTPEKPRPTVAYVGGYDGQLHAFYVSGGAGYTGPASPTANLNPSADTTFRTDFAAQFAAGTPPPPGTELWSFLPATQLPFLRGNNARVDSSPVVQDVFVDITGSGVREWRTVLVASIGRTGRELVAFDITDPLRPVLLWNIVGSTYQVGGVFPTHASAILTGDDTGGTDVSFKWRQGVASYQLPPTPDTGRYPTGLYNYRDLGGSSGITVGQMRAGLEPVYAVIVSTNKGSTLAAPAKGLEVFAIDISNGQKLWQWEQPYIDGTRASDNTVPSVVALRAGVDGVRRLYAGDMEGRLWELDAMTGANVNVARTNCASNCEFAAFDDPTSTATNPQPITSNIAVAKIPSAATGDFAGYGEEVVLMFGTAGADWVPLSVAGSIHSVLLADRWRKKPELTGGQLLLRTGNFETQAAVLADTQARGILQSPAAYPKGLAAPERVYGNLTVAGQTVFVPVASGQVNDLMTLSAALSGKTYEIDLSNAAAPTQLAGFAGANFGGVAVYHHATSATTSNDYVMAGQVNDVRKATFSNASPTGSRSKNVALNPDGNTGVTYRLLNWMRRFLSQ